MPREMTQHNGIGAPPSVLQLLTVKPALHFVSGISLHICNILKLKHKQFGMIVA